MANSLLDLNVSVEYAEAARELRKNKERLERRKRPAMIAALGKLHSVVTQIVPVQKVKGGRLKNSLFTEIENSGERGRVATNVYYAPYVEYGTRYMSPRRFMARTREQAGPDAIQIYKSILLQG